MEKPETLHVTPVEGGAWAVQLDEGASALLFYQTRAEAIAGALEAIQYRAEAEVFIHGPEGGVDRILTIREFLPPVEVSRTSDSDDFDDPDARAEALRMTPSYARLKAGIGKYPPPPGDFDDEEMAC